MKHAIKKAAREHSLSHPPASTESAACESAVAPSFCSASAHPAAKLVVLALAASCALFACGCGSSASPQGDSSTGASGYSHISGEEAQALVEGDSGYVLVDVRQPLAYQYEHIAGAVNIPEDTLADAAATQLPDKDQTIIVYCDYGGVSKIAAEELVALGYAHVVEFDGMEVWQGETIRDESIQ